MSLVLVGVATLKKVFEGRRRGSETVKAVAITKESTGGEGARERSALIYLCGTGLGMGA